MRKKGLSGGAPPKNDKGIRPLSLVVTGGSVEQRVGAESAGITTLLLLVGGRRRDKI